MASSKESTQQLCIVCHWIKSQPSHRTTNPSRLCLYPTSDDVGLMGRHLYRLLNLCAVGLDTEKRDKAKHFS